MPICYQLVGVPGSGKSTWIKNQDWTEDCVVVSTDDFVEEYAKEIGSTYDAVFKDYMPTAVKLMTEKVIRAREEGKDIIWDQTSVSVKSRRRKFNMLRDYEHIAVVFAIPDKDELDRRLNSRPGKTIPSSVMGTMISGFVNDPPTVEEGFNEVWTVA